MNNNERKIKSMNIWIFILSVIGFLLGYMFAGFWNLGYIVWFFTLVLIPMINTQKKMMMKMNGLEAQIAQLVKSAQQPLSDMADKSWK